MIYFFFYNFIFDSILLEYFKLSSNLQNKKLSSFSTRPKKKKKKIHDTQSFVIHSQSIPDSHSHTKYHTSFQTRPVKYEFEFIERELQSARSRCITRSPIVYEYLRASVWISTTIVEYEIDRSAFPRSQSLLHLSRRKKEKKKRGEKRKKRNK